MSQSPRNPKEEAQRFYGGHYSIASRQTDPKKFTSAVVKTHAVMTARAIIKALEITTGHCTLSDQDRTEVRRDINYWIEVEREIHKL